MNLTYRQASMLRHIATHDVTMAQVAGYHNGYIWQLAQKGLIANSPKGLQVTRTGSETLKQYQSQEPVLRKQAADLTEHVRQLLRVSKLRRIA